MANLITYFTEVGQKLAAKIDSTGTKKDLETNSISFIKTRNNSFT